jgi:hypothetical protein
VEAHFAQWLQSIEASALAEAIRQSTWLYPFLEIVHILGIVIVAGAAVMFDLLLLFFFRRGTIESPAFQLLRWSKRGLLIVVPSGILLFTTNAATLGFDITFYLKLSFLTLAGFNAFTFHKRVYMRHVADNTRAFNTGRARWHAGFSLALWTAVISCGRLLAY